VIQKMETKNRVNGGMSSPPGGSRAVAAGIVVTDLSLTPIAVDRGASAILNGAYMGDLTADASERAAAVQLPKEVLEFVAKRQAGEVATGEIVFRSNGAEYVCRVFQIEPQNSMLQQPVLVLHFEKEAAAPSDAVYQVAADYGLTDREQEALVGISLGLTSKELAKRMNISPNTVRAFLRLIMIKMDVSTRGGVVAKILDRAQNQAREAS
jgi:DNA-binding CsgD family transcriptional regulator